MIKVILILLIFPFSSFAQDANEQSSIERKVSKTHLRGWICGANEPAVSMVLIDEKEKEPLPIAAAAESEISADEVYKSFTPGVRIVQLRSGDKVLSSTNVLLKEGQIYTLLAWKNGSEWRSRLFSDSVTDEVGYVASLRVINFADGRESVISVDGKPGIKISSNSINEIQAPLKTCMVRVSTLAHDGGPPAQSTMEVNFKTAPSTYVVVGTDYRGLIRPAIILGGQLLDEKSEIVENSEDRQR
jgi:hypothetical protein